MVWEDSGVQHVGVCEHDMSAFPDRLAGIARCVPVVGEHPKAVIEPLRKVVQFGKLVLGQCFGGKEIKCSGAGVFEHSVYYRQVVAEGLAGCRRRHYDDVLPFVH